MSDRARGASVSAPPPPGAPEDHAARDAARRTFERPFVLEAGAGTGKTSVLTARILTWCLGAGWERASAALGASASGNRASAPADDEIAARVLSRVAAITFTEKAAAEMEGRVARDLRELAAGGSPRAPRIEDLGLPAGEAARRARSLLGAFDRFEAATIHAFCRRLISAHPVEAGVAPGFEVDAEGVTLEAAVDEALAAFVARSFGGAEPGDDALALAIAGHGPASIGAALQALAESGADPGDLAGDPCAPERARAAAAALRSDVFALLRAVEAPILAGGGKVKGAKDTVEALRGLAEKLDAVATIEDLARVVDPGGQDVTGLKKLGDWAANRKSDSEADLIGPAAESLDVLARPVRDGLGHLQAIDPDVLRRAFRVIGPVLRDVRERLRRDGALTFHDLLSKTRDLLAGDEAAASRIRRSLDQLLVDEFQDTDPLQYDIVERLALDGPPAERPGLFLVGDPKQSIYGWRNADLGAYARFLGRVLAAGGEMRSLTVNFRSVPAILDEVTRIVSPVMIPVPGLQPPFERLIPGLPSPPEAEPPPSPPEAEPPSIFPDRAAVEHWISWLRAPIHDGEKTGPATSVGRARELEAAAVAADLATLRREPGFRLGDVAVLARTVATLETVLDAFREAGIPYLVEKDCTFFRRREVFDAVSLLRTVLDPLDHLALAGFLRSPLAGVPDAALPKLWASGVPDGFGGLGGTDANRLPRLDAAVDAAAAATPADVPGIERVSGWTDLVKSAARTLDRLRRDFRTEDADVFLSRLRGLFLAEVSEAARHRGAWRIANLDRLFRRLLSGLTSGDGGPAALLRELRAALEQEREEEEGRPGDTARDAVRVMTIHKAKGLMFAQVYVVGLHGGSGRRGSRPDGWAGRSMDGAPEFCLFGVPTPGFAAVARRQQEVAAAEMVRLLYVATTRPARRLVLAGRWGDPAKAPPTIASPKCLADLLRHRSGNTPDLTRLAADPTSRIVDGDGILWRVLGAMESADGVEEAAPDRSAGAAGTAADVGDGVAARRAHRAGAADRSRRRLTAGVTAGVRDDEDAETEDAPGNDPAVNPIECEGVRRRRTGTSRSGDPDPRGAARAIGSAIHRVLENLALDGPEAAAVQEQRARLPLYLREHAPEPRARELVPEAEELLARIASNGMVSRLRSLGPAILGREVPLVAGPAENGGPEAGPVGARVGAIDLLYRDPGEGAWVVADYKSEPAGDTAEAASGHVLQGRAYAEAVQGALGLQARPRFELWFLREGKVVPVSLE